MNATEFLEKFTPHSQRSALRSLQRGEEGQFFRERLAELRDHVATMPRTYATDGKGDAAPVGLHYFTGRADWYIVELDASASDGSGHAQAFGLADLGYGPELGYISIPDIIAHGAELDLHFTTCTVGDIKRKRARRAA